MRNLTETAKRNREEYLGNCKRIGWNVNLSKRIVNLVREKYPKQEIIFNNSGGIQWDIYVVNEKYKEAKR